MLQKVDIFMGEIMALQQAPTNMSLVKIIEIAVNFALVGSVLPTYKTSK